MADLKQTEREFQAVLDKCRLLYAKKLQDYGVAWRILRPASLTDQLYIKANRIRTLQTKTEQMVDEDEVAEFIGLVNYAIIGIIQLHYGAAEKEDMSVEEAISAYQRFAQESLALMLRKNHDYDEAWREMRVSSFTDLILMKIFRTKQIEDNKGLTIVSEGIEANYQDIMNYAVFALIKLGAAETEECVEN